MQSMKLITVAELPNKTITSTKSLPTCNQKKSLSLSSSGGDKSTTTSSYAARRAQMVSPPPTSSLPDFR
jgi:hypothetical protein